MPSELDPRPTRASTPPVRPENAGGTESDVEHDPAAEPEPRRERDEAPSGSFEVLWTAAGGLGDSGWDLPERFELKRDLGDGALGPLFAVRDSEHDGALLRLEVVSNAHAGEESAKVALEESLRAISRLDSPFVARCVEVGRLGDGRVFALREHAEGESLATRLEREGSLHASQALEIARQALRGIAALHDAGLAHGAFSAASIWLATRTSKPDANPFGIAAKIVDAGLARRELGEGAEADLRAVGAVLARMLEAGAEPESTRHSAARALAESLRADGPAAYASADQARLAIDALLAPQRSESNAGATARTASVASSGDRGASRGLQVAFSLAAVGCFALGWFGWRLSSEVDAAERSVTDERSRAEKLRAQDAAERAALQQELDRLTASLAARTGELEAAKQTHEQLERQRLSVAELAEAERAKGLQLAGELDDNRRRLDEVGAQLRRASQQVEEPVRAARGLDATLQLIDQGRGEQAHRRASLLESEGLFGTRTSFVSTLAAAFEHLERFGASEQRAKVEGDAVLDVAAVAAAARALERAEAQRAEFLAETSSWVALEFVDAPGKPRPERIADALASLRTQLDAAAATREAAHAREWASIMASPGIQDPADAFQHAERFGCGHLDELGQRFARELRAWVLVGELLDIGRLNTFHQLPSWAERVESTQVKLPADLAADLTLLAHAQRWYDFDAENDARLDLSKFNTARVSSPTHDWRAELALQWRLGREDSPFPPRAGQKAWRRSVDAAGNVEWWRDSVEGVDDGMWRIRRTRFSADGRTALGEGLLRIERKDARFVIAGASVPLLDLRAHGEGVLVGPTPVFDAAPPPAELALGLEALEAVRTAAQRDSCLIFVQGDVRRWYSPRLGLVREETQSAQGTAVSQLVSLEP
jgi:hypothetical protein